jgi:hypothetical protein
MISVHLSHFGIVSIPVDLICSGADIGWHCSGELSYPEFQGHAGELHLPVVEKIPQIQLFYMALH